jgi:hypothetical protein
LNLVLSESRKKRWDQLNVVLDLNKKAKKRLDSNSVGYSYVTWPEVENILKTVSGKCVEINEDVTIPADMIASLATYLSYASLCFGVMSEGNEAKRVHCIAPILIIVCAKFNGDIKILIEEDVDGVRVHAHGHFEFVLKRGNKRICIVEAKKDDILQGKTQSLVGCESLADIENLEVVYGISTNYLEWCFLKSESDKITEEMLTIQLENNAPTIVSLTLIANKICAMLS